ncbi:4-(cytidine 5'-diphospho)-2-C-methyl-D-erythritol kinase [Paracoccaceae bacterium GXU_MW_L88]
MPNKDPGFAPAKINLALHVTGQRPDGLHLLDSLVVFAGVGDRLRYAPGGTLTLEVKGPFGPDLDGEADNLILRAARLCGAGGTFLLEKNLPVASGIGGGSADAAATLRLLAEAGFALPHEEEILALGADVPVCLRGENCMMRGIGEEIDPVDLPALQLVLVNPGVSVSTSAVFKALEAKDNPEMTPLADPFADWLRAQRNDLEAPAKQTAPEIATVLNVLEDSGAWLARMSGSGATCFGLFESADAAKNAAAEISNINPEWWVRAAQTTRETTKSGNS